MQEAVGGVNGNKNRRPQSAAAGICLPAEFVNGFAVVFFACLGEGLGPFGMVDRVGVELGFQRDAGAVAVMDAALAGFVQIIACVELDAGAIRVDGHGATGIRVTQNGTGGAENLEIVVVTGLQVQAFVICADVAVDGLGLAEVEGCALNLAQFTGGNVGGIVGIEETAGNGQLLMDGFFGIMVAGQIEVAVVGHVENRVAVCNGIVGDVQTGIGFQRIGDADHGISRETLIARGAVKAQGDGIICVALHLPEAQVEAIGAAVEAVAAFVGMQADSGIAQQEGGTADAVGIAAYGCAEETAVAGAVALCIVKAQNHIVDVTLTVGNKQRYQMCAVVSNCGGQLTTGYGVKKSLFSGGQKAERCFHIVTPFIFVLKRVFLEACVFGVIIPYSDFNFKSIFAPDGPI